MSQQRALELLRQGVGSPTTNFHEHQWESVDAIVNQRCRLICVQRTGWGKSSVYFISTKMMRDQGHGPTIIISPLLALMRNQIESAAKYGVALGTVNSSQSLEQNDLNKTQLLEGNLDALIIAPEQLANDDFVSNVIIPSNPGLFVIDEAHCISDWGHDFRPDYRRISRVLRNIADTPVLATTATATSRVVEDVVEQLRVEGQQIYLLRGQLTRESIHLQNIYLDKRSKRLAWLAHTIPQIQGTGIVYATTISDAFLVADWLRSCGIAAEGYAGSIPNLSKEDSVIKREQLEQQLLNNEIKVLVSTSALGMGFDKGDLAFVFHYQSAGSVVSYYQQVGRAGRSIDDAYGVLLSGDEDHEIQSHFIREAFPKGELVRDLLALLEEDSCDGLKKADLEAQLNYAPMKIEAALRFLQAEYPTPIVKEGPFYKRTINAYSLPTEMIQRLSERKTGEWQEIQAYLQSKQCLMQVLASALDDELAAPCGKCANCDPNNAFEEKYPEHLGQRAVDFLGNTMIDIPPKKQVGNGHAQAASRFREYDFPYRLGILEHEPGAALCHWGEAGWGEIAADGKRKHAFEPRLAEACVAMIYNRWKPDPMPTWVTYVPSQNYPNLVKDFAELVAHQLGLECVEAVLKVNHTEPQKRMENSDFRCKNLDGAFAVQNVRVGEPVLLIDDASDSGWTFAVIAALLRRQNSGPVFPMAVMSTKSN
ncbi:RecQ family ATP-dependent DNA helicase [Pseudoalteromonas xiamenensis]|uniref:RecQ family ATP-dependent DNA helicase n=1 Tax=Pseudoalteromonas xiamenensis TaxID=882626 RepID=UPI0035EB8FEF